MNVPRLVAVGDCEGDIPCLFTWVNRLAGVYFRWHPTGRHGDKAADWVAQTLNASMDNWLRYPKVLAEFNPLRHCDQLRQSLEPLRSSVIASNTARQPVALAAIERFASLCAAHRAK